MSDVYSGEFTLDELSRRLPNRTKVVCTLGKTTSEMQWIEKLVDAGMNVVRMNFSHGDHAFHGRIIDNVMEYRRLHKDRFIALMLDTKGPEIRTSIAPKDEKGADIKIVLEADKTIEVLNHVLTLDGKPFWADDDEVEKLDDAARKELLARTTPIIGSKERIGVTYRNIVKVTKKGDPVLIEDGNLTLIIEEVHEDRLVCTVKNAHVLGSTKNVNLPNSVVDLPAVTAKDRDDIIFGARKGIDYIAASFVRKAADVREIRQLLQREKRWTTVKIISKIESGEGIHNFEEILAASDGIMVARGDLGTEIPIEKVSIAQKWMIAKCNAVGKLVITATQMLDSMIEKPRPTRAEATDVANAVFDGTDCVMLSGETANGKFPVESVQMMVNICREAEHAINYNFLYESLRARALHGRSIMESVCSSAVKTAQDLKATMMIVMTEMGNCARLVAKYRPSMPVLCVSSNDRVLFQCSAVRNLIPWRVGTTYGVDSMIEKMLFECRRMMWLNAGDLVVVVVGLSDSAESSMVTLRVVSAP